MIALFQSTFFASHTFYIFSACCNKSMERRGCVAMVEPICGNVTLLPPRINNSPMHVGLPYLTYNAARVAKCQGAILQYM